MRKSLPYIAMTLVFCFALFDGAQLASAESIKELEEEMNRADSEQKKLEQERHEISSEKLETEEKLNGNLKEQKSVSDEIKDIDAKVAQTQNQLTAKEQEIHKVSEEIKDLEGSIKSLGKEIVVLNNDIKELKIKIKKRQGLLENRLRSIQKSGGQTTYMQVILGSTSFADFVSRSLTVTTIMNQDKSIMEQHAIDQETLEIKVAEVGEKKKTVEEKKVEVEINKTTLEKQKVELVKLDKQLNKQLAEKETLIATLESEYADLEDYNISLEDEEKILSSQSAALQKAKEIAQSQKSELEHLAKVQAEKERKAKEQAERERLARIEAEKAEAEKNNQGTQQTGSQGSNTEEVTKPANPTEQKPAPDPNPNVQPGNENGIFVMPTTGRLTSPYGYRTHPIFKVPKLHAGMDIANSTGTPVNAAATGVVIQAGWFGGYGNAVTIAHSINGKSYVTLYAHLSSISVSNGQVVNQNQLIGRMGSTGNSTGPHLHFEVHIGSFASNGANTVNPINYIY